jgi:Protein of unknown function (DUF4238)
MKKKRQHFVPQHYLRQFRIEGTTLVAASLVEPYKFIGTAAINRQCQEDYFYGADGALDDLMTQCETDLAPVLARVTAHQDFDSKEMVALRMLSVLLHFRTKKAVENAKLFPRRIAFEVIKNGIERGKLPEPKGGWSEEMMDIEGVPGFLIKTAVLPCFFEMQTLQCKILKAPPQAYFITSDHPVVMLNPFAVGHQPGREFVGFGQSGFQLLLPIAPTLALMFADRGVYKLGCRRDRTIPISARDVDLINSLQVQSADNCLYFHCPGLEPEVRRLVQNAKRLRIPAKGFLRTYPGKNEREEFLHIRAESVRLPSSLTFCRYRRRIQRKAGTLRDPAWSAVIQRLFEEVERNPGDGDVFARLRVLLSDEAR